MNLMDPMIEFLIPFRGILTVGFYFFSVIAACVLILAVRDVARKVQKDNERMTKERLRNLGVEKIGKGRRGQVLRAIVSPDGIDAAPNGYLVISDGGSERFVRTFTLTEKPKTCQFGRTFTGLFNFPGVTSSVFINPLSEEEMSRKLDHHITVLTAESDATSDPNRLRRLNHQRKDAAGWAEDVENGDNKFFRVGFLFSLYAESLTELNKASDAFYSEALGRGMHVSNCFGMQAEAYALNGPFAGRVCVFSKEVTKSPVSFVTMDKYSLSTVYNYLQSSFTHRSGVPIGRDLFSGNLVLFDLFDPTHDSMSAAIAGVSGSGKSTFIKTWTARQSLFDWHFVAIDSQQKIGTSEGEYAAEAIAQGGVNYQIRHDSVCVLNPFDISETVRSEKISEDTYREVRTVDLAGKIVTLVNILCSMILSDAGRGFDTVSDQTYVKRILTDSCALMYQAFGIEQGKVDSLYEEGMEMGASSYAGRKNMPTLSDFYLQLLKCERENRDETLFAAYSLILNALKDYVKSLYYDSETFERLTEEEYSARIKRGESPVRIEGTKSYYDGQSSVPIDVTCPFANFDISMLPDDEKKLARQIVSAWINECFIKKNSERLGGRAKLVLILDEVHEAFKDPYATDTIDIVVREARKRHVGIILSTQTLSEYDRNPVTKDMLKLIECKFIFRQDYQDRQWLIDNMGLTGAQADVIVSQLGGSERATEEAKKRHKGEMCIIDGKKVCFCKVDYLKKTEALIADTDASAVEKLIRVSRAG